MAKKKKIYPDDDGHTICNMNVEGMPWYESEQVKKNRQSLKEDAPTKKEVRAMIKARFLATLPYFLSCLIAFGIVACLMYLWLRRKKSSSELFSFFWFIMTKIKRYRIIL